MQKKQIYIHLFPLLKLQCVRVYQFISFSIKGIIGYIQGQSMGVFVLFISIIIFSIFEKNIHLV